MSKKTKHPSLAKGMIIIMNKKGSLIVLIGPSGSGKGTVLKEVLEQNENIFLSVSATTRKPRVGEVDGINYFFLETDKFEELIKTDSMLEYASYCGNFYGTPKATVLSRINNGENVILEIEVKGAKQIKEIYPDAVLIFIIPQSLDILKKRLVERGTEDEETVNKRMAKSVKEIKFASECDYIVVNNVLESAIEQTNAIIKAQSCRVSLMETFINEYLEN